MDNRNRRVRQTGAVPVVRPRPKTGRRIFTAIVLIAVVAAAGFLVKDQINKHDDSSKTTAAAVSVKKPATTPPKSEPAAGTVSNVEPVTNACSSNSLNQLVVVSISARQLWACNGTTLAYSSPVITGMEFLAADLTPVGTYHIYGKETNVVLKGSDSTGSWSDPVSYWMPFLDNQYGAYGFHDATWRASNAFGNISPNSSDASHGCVECPLATAAWLYSWSTIGTTVTIES